MKNATPAATKQPTMTSQRESRYSSGPMRFSTIEDCR